MRLSNRNKAGFYNFLNTFFLMLFVCGIAAFLLERYKFDIFGWESYIFLIVPTLLLVSYYLRGRQIFEYDSDGEALNFKNRNIITFLNRPVSDEFPKYKLQKYEVVNAVILKRLYITVSSKKNHSIILKYDISYLTDKEFRDLKYSLDKVIKENKENLHLCRKI